MNKEFFEAVKALEKEKGIPADYMFEKVKAAIVSATRNSYGNRDNVVVEFDTEKAQMRVYVRMAVVEEVEEKSAEMTLEQARSYDPNAQIGSFVEIPLEPKKFARIVAQTAKSVIRQGIREAEREIKNKEMQSHEHEMATARVNMVYPDTGDASIEIGKTRIILSKSEQLPNETLAPDQYIKVYVSSIKEENGTSSYVQVSRRHPALVKRLFETEVKEISDGTVEIVSISREAGSRTKIAVKSNDTNVDPVSACIGIRGQRVSAVVESLCGEKIDIVRFDENVEKYIAGALAPAEVLSVIVSQDENAKACRAIVPDSQLSLAIGNKGQNVRLAARLTGWKIDIKPLSKAND